MGYGCVLAALGLLLLRFTPEWPGTAGWAGLGGGILSCLWGGLGVVSKPRRGWAILTLAVTGFVLLSQMIIGWTTSAEMRAAAEVFRTISTVMFALTFGMVMVLAYGTLGEPSSSPSRAA